MNQQILVATYMDTFIRRSHYYFLAVNFRFFDVANFNPVYLQASIIPIIEGHSIS